MSLLRFGRCSPDGVSSQDWFHSEPGRQLVADEQQWVDRHIAGTAGYRAMLLTAVEAGLTIDAAPQLHRFAMAPQAGSGVAALSDVDELPLPSEAVELAVLHHVLDFSDYPHQALNEAARVVQASGSLVVVGFHPWSFFGLWRLFGRLCSANAIWQCRCLSAGRVIDWLKLVGMQPEKISYGAYRPPFRSPRVYGKLGLFERCLARIQLPVGGFYVITARKVRLRPIRGGQPWLVQAIKPVKLASRGQAKTGSDKGTC